MPESWYAIELVHALRRVMTATDGTNAETVRTLIASAGEHRGEPYGASFLIECPLGEFKVTVEQA